MTYLNTAILGRIEWCWWQRTLALTQLEMEAWRAEEEGLRDALLHRDHTNFYRYCPEDVFMRYAMGLEDGQALIRLANVDRELATSGL